MFLVGELGATINANRKPFDRTLNSVFRDGGRMMRRLGTQMTMALTLPLAGAGALAVKTAADYEQLQTSMAVLNGSVEEGTRQFERLQEFSARTPFQLKDLAQAQNMLQGFGQSADEAFESVEMIGDIAAVAEGDIKGIGIAFGQAAAEGRLMTRDIRQLINQGVPAIKMLADTMGVAQSEVLDLASDGEISFEILQQAFQDATSEGGMFANGMEKQSQTISGLFSTLRDNVDIALGDIGNSLAETFDLKGLVRDLTESIQTGIQWFNSLSDETRAMAFQVAGLLGASGPIIAALGALSLAFSAISAPLAGMVALVGGASVAIISHWDEIVQYFTQGAGNQMWESIKTAGQSLFATLRDLFQSIADFITAIWGVFGDDMVSDTTSLMERVVNAVEVALDGIGLVLDTFTLAFTGDWDQFWSNNEDRVTRFGENLEDYFMQLFSPSNLLAAVKRITFVNIVEGWAQQIGEGLAKAFEDVPDEPFQGMEDSAQGFFDRFNGMAERSSGVLKTNVDIMLDDLERFQQFLAADFGSEEVVNSVARPFVKAEKPADVIIQSIEDIKKGFKELSAEEILSDVGDVNLGEKIAPPGSMAFLNEQIQKFQQELAYATDPARVEALRNKIADLKLELSGQTQITNALRSVTDSFTSSFGQGLTNLIVGAESLNDTLRNIGKLLLSSTIQTAIKALLTGGLGGGGFFGIGGGLFGSIFGVDDALITSGGDVVQFHPNDNILAMKDFSNLMPSGDVRPMQGRSSSLSGAQIEQAFGRALDRKLQRLGPQELFGLMQRGSVGY